MTADLLTVMWKERKGLFRFRGSRMRFWITMLSPVLLATFIPWQWGPGWVSQVPPLFIAFIIPLVLAAITVPDSFAGERERHTLETLLASRLPDRAILLGKLGLSVGFGWGVTILVLLLSLVVVNVLHWQGTLLFYTPPIALGSLGLSLLTATLVSGVGVLMSLRSETVQEAAQKLMALFLVPFMILQLAVFALTDQLNRIIQLIDGPQLLLIVLGVLLVLDVAVSALVLGRFRRARLIAG